MQSPALLNWWNALRPARIYHLAIASVFFFTVPTHASPAAAVDTDAPFALSRQLVSLSVNGQPAETVILALRDDQGGWLLPVDVLAQAKIRLPQQSRILAEDGISYVPLSSLNVNFLSFDERRQSLDVHFDTSAFDINRVIFQTPYQTGNPQVPEGMFVNYDLLLTGGSVPHSESLFTEWGVAAGKGIALLNLASVGNEYSHRFLRLETSYTQNRLSDMTTLRLGDSITRPATTLGRPVRFGGIQYSTDFRLRPGLVTVPVPTLSGQAALPSTAEVYVNNVLQSSTALAPGPFSITTAPIVTGDGDVLLRVRDIAGREELISGRFYSSPVLLAPGLTDFSVEAGALRTNYAVPGDRYESPFVSGAYRRGVTDNLTLEGGYSMASGGPTEILGSGSLAIAGWGVASLSAGISRDHDTTGMQFAGSLERRTRQSSLALRVERSDADYRQLGIDPLLRIRNLDMAFFSYRFDALGSLGLSFTRQQRAFGSEFEVLGASFSTQPTRFGSLIFNALHSRSEDKNYSMSIFWILPVGGGISASVSHTANRNAADTSALQMQKSAPYGEGVGWRLQAAINSAQQAAVHLQKPYASLSAEAASLRGQDSARLGLSGAVVRMNERWFFTRRVSGSYGLVQLPGIRNARVYVDNQLSTRTDDEGYALLPRLRPHVLNHVSIEQLDLPLDTRIDQLIARPVPAWRSGVLVNFAIKKANAATLRIVDAKGMDIPAGAAVTVRGSEQAFAVGREGIAYIEGLSSDTTVEIRWQDKQCTVNVTYAMSEDIVPYLGEFICKEADK